MSERDFHTEETEKEVTRTIPAVNAEAEQASDGTASPRRRRADRHRIDELEAEKAASAGHSAVPVFNAESATAREIANRMQAVDPLRSQPDIPLEPGSRVPPQAARMRAASRIRMAAEQGNRTERAGDQIGYAPGKISESDRRTVYASHARMEASRTDAGGVPRQMTGGGMDPRREKKPPRKRGRTRVILLVLLLAAGLLAAGYFLIPEDAEGFPGTVKRTMSSWMAVLTGKKEEFASGVTGFIASGYEDAVAPTDVTFAVTTTKDILNICLTGKNGEVLETDDPMVGDNTDQTLWQLKWHLDDGYEGEVRLQVLTDKGWMDTEYVVMVHVTSLPTVTSDATAQPDQKPAETEITVIPVTENPTPSPEPTEKPAEETEEESGPEGEDLNPGEEGLDSEEENWDSEEENWDPEQEENRGPGEEDLGEEEAQDLLPGEDDEGEPAEEAEITKPLPAQTPTPTEEPSPTPTETPKLTAAACEEADPSLISTEIIYNGNKKASEYNRASKEQITMPAAGEYTRQKLGVLTFRGDAFRQNAACGTVSGAASLKVAWSAETGSVKDSSSKFYYGIGWVGQPAIIKWSKEVRELSDLYDSKKEKEGLKEVIAAGLDGTVYFLDLADGTPTRNMIKLGYPMRGSPSIHPGGAPYMNVGQYARKMAKGTGKIGLRQYNLYTGKEMSLIDGLDGSNRRAFNNVGSFETSALMDRTSDSLITAGTNGLLYVIHLGGTFDYKMGTYTQSPSTVLLKSKAKGESDGDTAVEASVAMYDKYVFYADMGGILRCVDTDTMKTVWAVNTQDSVESTIALDFNASEGLDLFTANTLNKRKKGDAQIRCFDAMSGEEKWVAEFGVKKDTKNKTVSGFRASPVIGQMDLGSLVYYPVNNLSEEGMEALDVSETAALIALDKRTGKKIWAKALNGVAYSSPVAVYDKAGYGWIIQCCGDGTILLLDGLSGRTISELTVEGDIEGSPAVYNSTMVVGTTKKGANYIYGIRIGNE